MKKTEKIGIRLVKIVETKFSYDFSHLSPIETKMGDDLFKISLGMKIDPTRKDEDILTLNIVVCYLYLGKKILELETSNIFEILNIDNVITVNDNNITDNYNIIPNLLNPSIGALRGILAVKTSGTLLADYPLPLMDTANICEFTNRINTEVSK